MLAQVEKCVYHFLALARSSSLSWMVRATNGPSEDGEEHEKARGLQLTGA